MTASNRFVRLSSGCLCLALLLFLAWSSSARAEFGVVPGTTIAKTHDTVPMLQVPGAGVVEGRRLADRDGIVAALPVRQAGAHPDATGAGDLVLAGEAVKDFVVEAPPGFVGNPNAVPPCSREEFRNAYESTGDRSKACSPASQVGVITLHVAGGVFLIQSRPIYRLTPSPGVPASFGFPFLNYGILINANVRTDGDYGLTISATDISGSQLLDSSVVTLWGVPADPDHDSERWHPTKDPGVVAPSLGDWNAPSGLPRVPFIQTPTDCNADSLITTTRLRTWSKPDLWLPESPDDPDYAIPAPQPTGCEKLSFKPTISLQPSITNSDSPTGASVEMEVPQNYNPDGLSTPQLKKAVVTLPEGMSVNPAAADGIEGCSTRQIGLLGTDFPMPNPIRFAKGDADCPQASKVGTGVVNTALLDDPLHGDVYLATPYDNPFRSLLALYLVFRGPGFVVKLPGKVEPDPVTGQLKTTFDNSPQLPFDDLTLDFFGGPRAPLATSPVCGEQRIETVLTPWSAPFTPDADPDNRYQATQGPAGARCSFTRASRPFGPQLTAGTESPIAGGFSAFTMRLTRPDGHQELAGLTVRPPLGFAAVLKGVPYCSEARIAAAEARPGKAESAFPSCPEASRVGSVLTGAGAGPTPFFAPGNAYLAGPYKGAPLSLAVVTPAIAGGTPGNPVFDLGTVVVRVALHVDPHTAQVTAVSDPVPQMLEGIPLRVKDIRVKLDRPRWGINPTSCAEKLFEVSATGQNGAKVELSNRFQVLECANLGFKPRLRLTLKGGTRRGANPALRAVVRPRPGDANIGRAAVTLPKSAFLDQAHIRTICTRVQWAEDSCPKAARYGYARAWSPLLDQPLQGPVYLRSSDNELPDLVADLRGPAHQPIKIEAAFRTDSIRGGIRSTLGFAPDAPVSRFVLRMQGGKKGLIVNSRNLCSKPSFATARLGAHNGRAHSFKPRVVAKGCAKARKHTKRKQPVKR